MATVKIKFRPSSVNAKEGILFYQVIHNRVARQINTGCKIYPAEWDNLSSRVVIPPGTEESRCHYLHSLENRIKEDTTRLRYILARLDRTDKDYSADKVVELFFYFPRRRRLHIVLPKSYQPTETNRKGMHGRNLCNLTQQFYTIPG